MKKILLILLIVRVEAAGRVTVTPTVPSRSGTLMSLVSWLPPIYS